VQKLKRSVKKYLIVRMQSKWKYGLNKCYQVLKKYYCKDESIVNGESIPFIDNINAKLQKLKNKQEADKETPLQTPPPVLPLERKK
jgi:hypothetical protein